MALGYNCGLEDIKIRRKLVITKELNS